MWKSINKILWKSNTPVVMILSSTDSISPDIKAITFNIYHLSPPQVIGKYKIFFSCLCFIQLLFSTRSAWEVVVSVSFPWPHCTICAVKAFASLQSYCVTINTLKSFFWFQNTIDCCSFDCVVSINSIQKAWYGDDDRFCLSVHALVKWANKKEHGRLILNLICYFHNLNIIDMDMSAFSRCCFFFFCNSISCLLWEDHINMFT